MRTSSESETNSATPARQLTRRKRVKRLLGILAGIPAAFLLLLSLALIGLDLWLTPGRLASMASAYAVRYLDANVNVGKISYTFWSTFPRFEFQIDSVEVVSRRLRSLTAAERMQLPAHCDSLASFVKMKGSFYPLKLLSGRIDIDSLLIDGLRVNMVALNDSVNNYSILAAIDPDKPFHMPRFKARHVSLTHLRPITYYSAATEMSARIDLDRAALRRTGSMTYALDMRGDMSMTVEKMPLLSRFPFELTGNVGVDFNPFRIQMERYDIALGNVRSQVDLSLQLGDNNSQLTKLKYNVSAFTLMRLFEYLPAHWLPSLKAIRSNASLEASVSLTAPYHFASDALPSFRVNFHVPDSWLRYSLPQGDINIHNIGMKASLDFNGNDIDSSRFHIHLLSLAGPGVRFLLRGQANRLFSNPCVSADVQTSVDLAALNKLLPFLPLQGLEGLLSGDFHTSFPLSRLSGNRPDLIPLQGTTDISRCAYRNPKAHVSVSTRSSKMSVNLQKGILTLRLHSYKVKVAVGKCNVATDNLHLDASLPPTLKNGEIDLRVALDALKIVHPLFRILTPRLILTAAAPGGLPLTDLLSTAANAHIAAAVTCLHADSVKVRTDKLNLAGTLSHRRLLTQASLQRTLYADSVNFGLLRQLGATLRLDFQSPLGAAPLLRRHPSGSLTASGGAFTSIMYPAATLMPGLDISFTPTTLSLHQLSLRSQTNAMTLSVSLDNYAPLLSAADTSVVNAHLSLRADTININQLAGTLAEGHRLNKSRRPAPSPASGATPAPSQATAKPWLLPRNIAASMDMRINDCRYTNLDVRDIDASIRMAEGILTLDTIHAATDFGSASASVRYNGADSLSMALSCKAALDTINVVTFLARFHTLLEMMPQLGNLSGNVSLGAHGGFDIYPDMDINLPSLTADIYASGRHLKVHQSHFIHRLCRYLLIHTDSALSIRNMDVRATIHDNQLELYPFIFEVNRYKLALMGENDFAGNLYYHISVLHSPVPFRFGINVTGNFDNYHIRFGSPRFHADKAMRAMHLLQNHKINLVKEMHIFGREFMHRAARADSGTPHLPLVDTLGHTMTGVHERLLQPAGTNSY